MRHYPLKWAHLVLLTFVASFFMFYQVGKVPPLYPWSDEASAGQDALATLKGGLNLYYPDQGGGGNLWVYLGALAFWLIEPNLITLRWLAGLVGVLSVLWLYGASTELLRTFMPINRARWYSFLAAIWMAVSTWQLLMSRVAWPPVLCPLIVSAVTLFLWRGLRTRYLHNFVGLGVALGVSFYLYIPCRFILMVPLVFLTLEMVISLIHHQYPKWWDLRSYLLVSVGVTLLVAAPMIILYLTRPETFTSRISEVSIQANSSYRSELLESLYFHADVFGLTFNWQRSPMDGLILGNVTTVLFLTGVIVTVLRISLPSNRYLMVWWVLLMIPAIAAPALEREISDLRRMIGSLPATFIFPVLALEFIEKRLSFIKPLNRPVRMVIVTGVAVSAIFLTARETNYDFFVKWPNSPSYYRLFNPITVGLVDWVNERTNPNTTFVFPIRAARLPSSYPWIHSMRFLYSGSASYIPNYEPDVPEALVKAVKDKSDAYLLVEKQADPKGQFRYLLSRLGTLIAEEKIFGFQVKHFALQQWPLPQPAKSLNPDIEFGSALRLRKVDYGITNNGSRHLWVELTWENIHSQADYQVVVKLKDQTGHTIIQQDKLLLNNFYFQPTSVWTDGSIEKDYYLLDIPPIILAGSYQLYVGVYDSQTLENLLPTTQDNLTDLTIPLGSVLLPSVSQAFDLTPTTQMTTEMIPGYLDLVGIDSIVPDHLKPGELITLPLIFQIDASTPAPAQINLELLSPKQNWTLSSFIPLEIPTDWPAKAPFRLLVDGRVPRHVDGGKYSLVLSAMVDGDILNQVTVGHSEVVTRTHQFQLPPNIKMTNISALFGERVQLQGYQLALKQTDVANQQVVLSLFWQAKEEIEVSYKVFVHLLDANGKIVTQIDREPQSGEALTTSWLPQEVIVDTFVFPLDKKLAQVTTMALGLYDPMTGKRLPLVNTDGEHVGSQVKIVLEKQIISRN